MKQKRGQANIALTAGLIFGIATLIVGIIIAFVVVSTLTDANLLTSDRDTYTVTNESGGYINATGYTLDEYDANTRLDFTITAAYNASDGELIAAGNYTLSNGVVTNATVTVYSTANFSYSYIERGETERSATQLSGNMTAGVDNVSSRVPTVLLVAAIVLILSILAVLIGIWQKMRYGGTGI